MLSKKALACSLLVVGFGLSTAAQAVTVTRVTPPGGTSPWAFDNEKTPPDSPDILTVLGGVNCEVIVEGTIADDGAVTITRFDIDPGNFLCAFSEAINLPWTGEILNVGGDMIIYDAAVNTSIGLCEGDICWVPGDS
jgi:hypothetical protein